MTKQTIKISGHGDLIDPVQYFKEIWRRTQSYMKASDAMRQLGYKVEATQ